MFLPQFTHDITVCMCVSACAHVHMYVREIPFVDDRVFVGCRSPLKERLEKGVELKMSSLVANAFTQRVVCWPRFDRLPFFPWQ